MKRVNVITHYGEDFLTYRLNFVNYLQEKGKTVFSHVPKDKFWEQINELDVNVNSYNYKRNWSFVFYLPKTFKQLVRDFRIHRIDTVFTYKFFPNIVGILAARIAKVKIIISTVAGLGFLDPNLSFKFLRGMLLSGYCKILDRADFVIVQNYDDLEIVGSKLKHAQIFLTDGSGVRPEQFLKTSSRRETCNNLGLDHSRSYLLFSSRIAREKGIIELIQAYKLINKPNYKYDLLIVGWFESERLKDEVMALIENEDRIHYLGYQSDMASILQLADFMVMPSYYPEGLPRTLTESLAASLPIVTTDHKGCRETVLPGENGYLVRKRSIKDLSLILNHLNDLKKSEIDNMRTKSKEIFSKRFDQKVVFDSIFSRVEQ